MDKVNFHKMQNQRAGELEEMTQKAEKQGGGKFVVARRGK